MPMLASTADPHATSHTGTHGDFVIFWGYYDPNGWFWLADDGSNAGPFATSQAAFGARKDVIDKEIAHGG